MQNRIYLAGPEVFSVNAKEIGQAKKKLCLDNGFIGFFPGDIASQVPQEIADECEMQIRGCEYVIANLTPFRGCSADVGTVYEMGYAKSIGKIIYGYTNTTYKYAERVPFTNEIDGALVSNLDNMAVENCGLFDNLMLSHAIEDSGGKLFQAEVTDFDDFFSNLDGFIKCLESIKNDR